MNNKKLTSFVAFTLVLSLAAVAQQPQQPAPSVTPQRFGYPANARVLIIHADDLGMNHSVNRAILEALEKRWVTSASIMVPCPWFPEVARWAKAHPDADLGIHLVITSEWNDFRWGPLASRDRVPTLLDKDGYLYLDTPLLTNVKPAEIDLELRTQIDRAQASGIKLSHLDSHMAALMSRPDFFAVYQQLGHDYKLPILYEQNGTFAPPPGSTLLPGNTELVGQVVSINPGISTHDWVDWYKKTLAALPPGVYELIVHLAYSDDEMRGATQDHPDWGAAWRQSDLDMVRSDDFQQFLRQQGFVLSNWKELAQRAQTAPHQ
jgi:predicted glycoside hydrolase/deacetylase ChbG (UPF0249 family)